MATAYYPQFDLVRIDADGFRVSLPSETIDVYNVSTATSLGTLTSTTESIIPAGNYTGVGITVGDIIELSHATYPGLARIVLQATPTDAHSAVESDLVTYVLENLYTLTTNTRLVDLYVRDADNPDVAIVRIGGGKSGTTVQIPWPKQPVVKNLDIIPVSIDENLNTLHVDYGLTTNFQSISVAAATGGGGTGSQSFAFFIS